MRKIILLPKQHGAWSMLFIPFLLGIIKGGVNIVHVPLFFGWLFLYFATFPLLMLIKKKRIDFYRKWTLIYGFFAMLFLIYPLIVDWRLVYFGLTIIPFFLVNIYHAKVNKERSFINDVSAVITFGIGGLVSYFFGKGDLDFSGWIVFVSTVLFFIGSTFYVKSMIREKNNRLFKYLSWIYHIFVLVLASFINIWIGVAYILSGIRAIVFYGKKLSVSQIGILEICNSIYFFISMIVYFSMV